MARIRELGHDGAMSRHFLLAARILSIFTVLVPALLALDVLQSGAAPHNMLIGLVIQLSPAMVLGLLVAVAWHAPVPGGIILVLVSGIPFLLLPLPFPINILFAAPPFLAGALFIAGGTTRS